MIETETKLVTLTKMKYEPEVLEWIEQIKSHHSNVMESDTLIIKHKNFSLKEGILCGEFLSKCKDTLGHGKWTTFCEEQIYPFVSQSTVNRYMRLFQGRDDLPPNIVSLSMGYMVLGINKKTLDNVDLPIEQQIEEDQPDEMDPKSHKEKVEAITKKRDTKNKESETSTLGWNMNKYHQLKNGLNGISFLTLDIDDKGNIIGRIPKTNEPMVLNLESIQHLSDLFKPVVEWYLKQNPCTTVVTVEPELVECNIAA